MSEETDIRLLINKPQWFMCLSTDYSLFMLETFAVSLSTVLLSRRGLLTLHQ